MALGLLPSITAKNNHIPGWMKAEPQLSTAHLLLPAGRLPVGAQASGSRVLPARMRLRHRVGAMWQETLWQENFPFRKVFLPHSRPTEVLSQSAAACRHVLYHVLPAHVGPWKRASWVQLWEKKPSHPAPEHKGVLRFSSSMFQEWFYSALPGPPGWWMAQ